ncbi:hypothetical protein BX600DRAFT_65374 [Xylariales sp. PMI_506]|nr:hypothetical protein BX600DRAFT_65374 [Xylariales sp. PMI_506]
MIDGHDIAYSASCFGLLNDGILEFDEFNDLLYDMYNLARDRGTSTNDLEAFLRKLVGSSEGNDTTYTVMSQSASFLTTVPHDGATPGNKAASDSNSSNVTGISNTPNSDRGVNKKRKLDQGDQEDESSFSGNVHKTMAKNSGEHKPRFRMPCTRKNCSGKDHSISELLRKLQCTHVNSVDGRSAPGIMICSTCWEDHKTKERLDSHKSECSKHCILPDCNRSEVIPNSAQDILNIKHLFKKGQCPSHNKGRHREKWRYIYALCNPNEDNVPIPKFDEGCKVSHKGEGTLSQGQQLDRASAVIESLRANISQLQSVGRQNVDKLSDLQRREEDNNKINRLQCQRINHLEGLLRFCRTTVSFSAPLAAMIDSAIAENQAPNSAFLENGRQETSPSLPLVGSDGCMATYDASKLPDAEPPQNDQDTNGDVTNFMGSDQTYDFGDANDFNLCLIR